MKNFLWFLAGANRFLLQMCPSDQNRFTKVGLTILITGIFAGITGGYAVYSTLGGNLFGAILVGIFWGIAIMNLDSLIVSTIKDSGDFKEKIKVAGVRILLSVFIGLIIARPFELKLFEKEIKDKLVDIELEKCIDRSDIETETTRVQLTDLENETKQLTEKNAEVYAELKCARELLTHERNGIAKVLPCGSSSGKSGNGERFQELVAWVNSLSTEHQQLDQSLKENRTQLAALRGNVLVAEDGCKQDSIHTAIMGAPLSLLEAHQTLHILSEEDAGIKTIVIVVTLLIILLELSPVIVKLMQKPGEYEKLVVEYEEDCRELTYLDLIQKYPFLPARKEYLENFQHNKEIHEKILSEQVAISQLNMDVQHQLDMIRDKQTIEKANELDVHEQITKDLGRRRLNVAEKISHQWEEDAANGNENAAFEDAALEIPARAELEEHQAIPLSQPAKPTLQNEEEIIAPPVSAFTTEIEDTVPGEQHKDAQEQETKEEAKPQANNTEQFVFDESFVFPFEEPQPKPELPKPPFPLEDKLPINTKAAENAEKVLYDLKKQEKIDEIKGLIEDVEQPKQPIGLDFNATSDIQEDTDDEENLPEEEWTNEEEAELAETNSFATEVAVEEPVIAEKEEEATLVEAPLTAEEFVTQELEEDQEPSEWERLATAEKMERIKNFIKEEDEKPAPPSEPVAEEEMETTPTFETAVSEEQPVNEEEEEELEEPLITEEVQDEEKEEDRLTNESELPKPPFPLEDKLPVNTKAADKADEILADLLEEDMKRDLDYPIQNERTRLKEMHPPAA